MKLILRELKNKSELTKQEIDQIVLEAHFIFMEYPELNDLSQRFIALTEYMAERGHEFIPKG
jgi:hypothetical protein